MRTLFLLLAITACASDPSDPGNAPDTVDAAHVAPIAQEVTCVPYTFSSNRDETTTEYRAELPLRAADFPRVWVRACDRLDMPVPGRCPNAWPCTGDVPPATGCTVTAVTTYAVDGSFSYDCGSKVETLINNTWTATTFHYYPSVTVLVEP